MLSYFLHAFNLKACKMIWSAWLFSLCDYKFSYTCVYDDKPRICLIDLIGGQYDNKYICIPGPFKFKN